MIPNLPTDNLNKFLCVGALLLLAFSVMGILESIKATKILYEDLIKESILFNNDAIDHEIDLIKHSHTSHGLENTSSDYAILEKNFQRDSLNFELTSKLYVSKIATEQKYLFLFFA